MDDFGFERAENTNAQRLNPKLKWIYLYLKADMYVYGDPVTEVQSVITFVRRTF